MSGESVFSKERQPVLRPNALYYHKSARCPGGWPAPIQPDSALGRHW